MVVILLTGMPGSGKEEFLKVARKNNINIIRMGDVVRKIADEYEISSKNISVGQFAHQERERHHYGIWAERTISEMEKDTSIIDGVRSYEEVDIFKAELQEKMQIVAIHASPETRYERLKKRGRDDKPHTWDEFIERDHRELDWGLGKIIALADKIIINEGSLSEFKGKVEEYLDSIAR